MKNKINKKLLIPIIILVIGIFTGFTIGQQIGNIDESKAWHPLQEIITVDSSGKFSSDSLSVDANNDGKIDYAEKIHGSCTLLFDETTANWVTGTPGVQIIQMPVPTKCIDKSCYLLHTNPSTPNTILNVTKYIQMSSTSTTEHWYSETWAQFPILIPGTCPSNSAGINGDNTVSTITAFPTPIVAGGPATISVLIDDYGQLQNKFIWTVLGRPITGTRFYVCG